MDSSLKKNNNKKKTMILISRCIKGRINYGIMVSNLIGFKLILIRDFNHWCCHLAGTKEKFKRLVLVNKSKTSITAK